MHCCILSILAASGVTSLAAWLLILSITGVCGAASKAASLNLVWPFLTAASLNFVFVPRCPSSKSRRHPTALHSSADPKPCQALHADFSQKEKEVIARHILSRAARFRFGPANHTSMLPPTDAICPPRRTLARGGDARDPAVEAAQGGPQASRPRSGP